MAIAFASVLAANDNTDATSYTTGTLSVVSGRLYVAAFLNSKATTPDAINTLTNNGGLASVLSWTALAPTSAGTTMRLTTTTESPAAPARAR